MTATDDILVRIFEDAIRIANGQKPADTTTAEGLLAYLASKFSVDAEAHLKALRARAEDRAA